MLSRDTSSCVPCGNGGLVMTENPIQRGDFMMRNIFLSVLAAGLTVLMLCRAAPVAAENEPHAGINIGNVPFSAPLTAADAAYLGLAGQTAFTLSDIKSPYVVVESMNTT